MLHTTALYSTADVVRRAKTLSGTSDELAARLRTMMETAKKMPLAKEIEFRIETAALRYVLRKRFAERHRWRCSDHGFSPEALADRRGAYWAHGWPREIADHPYPFRTLDRRPVALAAHLYPSPGQRETAHAWAREAGLRVEFPTDFPSWWFPGRTDLCVYTPAVWSGEL